jgi:PAS domain S-box-containing protein
MIDPGSTAPDAAARLPDSSPAGPTGSGGAARDRRAASAPSIRTHLFRLVLAALIPAFIFAAGAAFSAYLGRRAAAELNMMETARAVSAAFDAEFARRQALLVGLSNSTALRKGDLQDFYAAAKSASGGVPIVVCDAETGREILNTGVAWGRPIPFAEEPPWLDSVRRRGLPEVKDVRFDRLLGTYTVAVQTPVIVGGRVVYIVHSGETVADLVGTLRKFHVAANWRVSLMDRRGVRAASLHAPGPVAGAPPIPQLWSLIRAGREGIIRGVRVEDVPMMYAVARSPSTGYSVAVGVPRRAFSASVFHAGAWGFLGGAAAGGLGLALAAWMARRISRPLSAAAEAARSIGQGGPVELGPSGIREIDIIAGALAEASSALVQRAAERDRQQASLAQLALGLEARVQARTAELDAANTALAESETRLRAIFDSTFQLTGLATIDGRAVAVNRAALEAARVTEDQVLGKPMWDTPWWAGSPGERQRVIDAFQRVKAGEFIRFEGTISLPGGPRTFDFSMRPLSLHGGDEPDHVLAEGRDLTELKAAQERADRSQKMEALGLLTGGVAHDFNNILTVIKGAIEVALKTECEPRAERLLKAALEASQRGEELNKQLLGFARRRPVTQVRLEVDETVKRLEPLLRNAVGAARRLELDVSTVDGICVVEAAQFETALLNLVVNARDATPEGGAVIVRVREPTPELRRRFAGLDGDFVCVEVADTGHGIPPEHLSRVFDPFFTTKPPGQGTGLGLSQVYGFVRQSAGLIDVDSAPGQGTCVAMALPLDRTPSAEAAAPAGSAPAAAEGLRVLLVEDDPLVADVSEAMLLGLGHQTTKARVAREALQALEEGEFDLLFTDVIMPEGVNGVQLARAAVERRPGLKVLLCSGWTADALNEAELAKAPWPLLQKPFSTDDLKRAIAQATEAALPR